MLTNNQLRGFCEYTWEIVEGLETFLVRVDTDELCDISLAFFTGKVVHTLGVFGELDESKIWFYLFLYYFRFICFLFPGVWLKLSFDLFVVYVIGTTWRNWVFSSVDIIIMIS